MNNLNALTVDLFLYDLCDGLGIKPEEAKKTRQQFWQRLYPDLTEHPPAQIKETKTYFADYVELLADKQCELFTDSVDGYYYPVQLSDTYALQVDSSGGEEVDKFAAPPEAIETISTDIIKNRIHDQHGKLGESWLIWGQLSNPEQTAEATAKACYQALSSGQNKSLDWSQNYIGRGTLNGATLYELQQLDTISDGENNNHHVLICLFPAEQNLEQAQATMEKLYRHLIRLFQYRSKILWLYEESRRLKGDLKEAAETVNRLVSALSANVNKPSINLPTQQQQLSDALIASNIYEKRLNYLRGKETEIETNLYSYCDRLARIETTNEPADLDFLNHFVTLTKNKYLRQIQADTAAFESALKPLGNFIQTVQGITDIERSHNERVLNQTVAIAGVGISVASLAAASLSNQADAIIQSWRPIPEGQPPSAVNLWLSAALILLVSIAVGGLAALITSALVHRKTKS